MVSYRFNALAFLSELPPGAGLSSSLWPIDPTRRGAGLWPIDPNRRSAGLWPIDPTSANWPIDPTSASWPIDPTSANWPIDPNKPRQRAAPPTSPAAEWAEEQSLLSQALRQSRARIVRSSDAREAAPQRQKEALWRWAPDSRVKTVSCELIQRFQVHERQLWLVPPFWSKGKASKPVALYGLPPPLNAAELQSQVDKVLRAASEREDRMAEVLAQAPDFQAFFDSITGLPMERTPRLAELLAVMQDTGVHLVMLLKHAQAARRPVESSSRVMPMIATPGHGALPSGHATMAALTSELLYRLLYAQQPKLHQQRAEHLDRLARRIAFNRVVAGVHFPADSKAGYALGTLLARVFAALAGQLPAPPAPVDAEDIGGAVRDLPEVPPAGGPGRPALVTTTAYKVDPAPTLQLLWREAAAELKRVRV